MLQTYFLRGCEADLISSTANGATAVLPEALVITPGDYVVSGQGYSLRQEGLYRFLTPPRENQQRIVFENDIFALMSATSWLFSHGYRDNNKSFEDIQAIACGGKVIVTCGRCADFVVDFFRGLGIPARLVATRTLENSNGYNDGHVLTEVMVEGRWVVYDPDAASLYRHQGRLLNIVALAEQARAGDFQRQALAANIAIATGHFAVENYAFDLWYETALSTEKNRFQTLQRPLQVASIREDGFFYYTSQSNEERRRMEELYPQGNLKFLPPEEFYSRFYPEGL